MTPIDQLARDSNNLRWLELHADRVKIEKESGHLALTFEGRKYTGSRLTECIQQVVDGSLLVQSQ